MKIELAGITHRYGGDGFAVRDVHLSWESGGAYALLGPSGCGKTTLLKIISGLLVPTSGRVLFDGRDVTSLGPRERNVAQVFQFPVVYDTMTVADNLAFPLRNRGVADVHARVREVAEILELTRDLDRPASRLSADAKQKVSLGRGLVRTDVAAILLDEPLTVVDPHTKWQLRRKLREVHERLRVTLVYVTHDQAEALTLADTVVVMNEGRVVQQGTPQELVDDPRDPFVGWFIGTPGMNLLPCTVVDGAAIVDGIRIPVAPDRIAPAGTRLGIRPEHVIVHRDRRENALPMTVTSVESTGRHTILRSASLVAKVADDFAIREGDRVFVEIPAARARVY